LLMLLALIVFAAGFVVYSSDDAETIRIAERQKTARALAEAKKKLISYALVNWIGQGVNGRPGELPCPDTDNDGGSQGAACPSNIGWLPWKTLELEDLRDSSGHRLWYAVSEDFRDRAAGPVINPGSIGQFRVLDDFGLETDRAAAVIIAPGAPLPGQSRLESDNNIAVIQNYLENENAEIGASFDNNFTNVLIPGVINDQVITITIDEIMNSVAPVVMKEVAAALKQYFDAEGFYPYSELNTSAACDNNTDISRRNAGFPVVSVLPGCPYAKSLSDYALPAWVTALDWHKYVFSIIAEACVPGTTNCDGAGFLSLDGVGGIQALVAYTGRALNGITCFANPSHDQIRSPVAGWDELCNFLETVENTNGDDDLVYIRPAPAENSNDRFMIVAP
jgi:hypothetical protein